MYVTKILTKSYHTAIMKMLIRYLPIDFVILSIFQSFNTNLT